MVRGEGNGHPRCSLARTVFSKEVKLIAFLVFSLKAGQLACVRG